MSCVLRCWVLRVEIIYVYHLLCLFGTYHTSFDKLVVDASIASTVYEKDAKKYCNAQRERSQLPLFEEVKFEVLHHVLSRVQKLKVWSEKRYQSSIGVDMECLTTKSLPVTKNNVLLYKLYHRYHIVI